VAYVPTIRTLVDLLVDTSKPGDMLITQGAGDITQIGPAFIEAKRAALSGAK
jgi:UDP-N-acetylmuramate--alanine ligase